MLHVVTTGAYYPPVVTTWKILTTGTSYIFDNGDIVQCTPGNEKLKMPKKFCSM